MTNKKTDRQTDREIDQYIFEAADSLKSLKAWPEIELVCLNNTG